MPPARPMRPSRLLRLLPHLVLVAALAPLLACGRTTPDAAAGEPAADAGPATALATQAGVGARYGARDPRACPNAKAPTRGAPSAAQAAQYVICDAEGVHDDYLYLVEDVRAEVGAGRPYQVGTDTFEDIDPRQPVYPIRGSYTGYQCNPLRTAEEIAKGFESNRGTNCTGSPAPHATGTCFRSTFGDWHCTMVDRAVGVESYRRNIAPPQ